MIEAALQQAKFKNEYQKLRVNLLHTANWLSNQMREVLRPYDITQKQYNILKILYAEYPTSVAIQDVRCRMIDKMSDASRIIDRLVSKELIEKKPCDHDKRSNRVFLSEKGIALIEQIDQSGTSMDAILQHLSEEQAEELNELLSLLREKG
ncbi:MAG: MarR family winged helix-turn-helix transcriptional regulator [Saprospiraceae bacterium]